MTTDNYSNLYSEGEAVFSANSENRNAAAIGTDAAGAIPVNSLPINANTIPDVPEKPEVTFSRTDGICGGLLLLSGFLLIRLGFYHTSSLLTTLVLWGIFTLGIIFLKADERTKSFTTGDKIWTAVLYLFAAVDFVTASEFLKGLNLIFLVMAWNLFFLHKTKPEGVLRFLPYSLPRAVFALPFMEFSRGFQSVLSGKKSGGFWKNAAYIFGGLVIAIPLTCIVAALLCEADDNLSAMLGDLLRIPPEDVLVMIPQFLVGLLIGSGLFSALWSCRHQSLALNADECEKKAEQLHLMPNPMIYAMVTPICILYILYIISQASYFLGGFTGETNGLTYAEYARKGFFELCGICCINLAVIAGMGLFARITGAVKPMLLKIYSCFLSICSLFIAGTAIAKMLMYIRVYGMTTLRVNTTWFMLLLVIGFTALLVKQFVNRLNLGKIACIAFTVMFGLLCFSRPDAWIVRYNADHYLSGQLEEFDDSILYSKDAYAALVHYDQATRNRLLEHGHGAEFRLLTTADGYDDIYEELNLSALSLLLSGSD